MPYDPRPISEGGNRGASDTFTLVAPTGRYRLVTVDTFDGSDRYEDFDNVHVAIEHAIAATKDRQMTRAHVYDDQGRQRWGSF